VVWAVAAALLVGVGIGSAGGDAEDVSAGTADAAPSTSATAPSPVDPVPATTPAPATVTVTETPAPVATSTAPPTATAPVVDVTMPALVGLDLQSAQNAIQANGIFLSRSHDLLGMRNQVVDSNWLVCTQNIPAGEQVTGEAEGLIDLGVVKREELCA